MSEKWVIKGKTLVAIKEAICSVEGTDSSDIMLVNSFADRISKLPSSSSTLYQSSYVNESPATNIALSSYFSHTSVTDLRTQVIYMRTGFNASSIYSVNTNDTGDIQEYTTKGNRKFISIGMVSCGLPNAVGGYLCFWRQPFLYNSVTYYGFYCPNIEEQEKIIAAPSYFGTNTITSNARSDKKDNIILITRE